MKSITAILISSLIFSSCDSADPTSKIAGTWSYSDSRCEGDDTTVQGTLMEIEFEADGDGTRLFETNSCLITNKFKWVMDGKNIVMASKSTTCEPADCDQALEVGGVDFLLSCSQNFDDVWKNSEFQLDGNIAVESFKVQNLDCTNRFINPEIE